MSFGKRAYLAWVNCVYLSKARYAPKWEDLPERIQKDWAAIAGAVLHEFLEAGSEVATHSSGQPTG